MYEKDFPHEEYPDGIIRLSRQRFTRTRNIMYKYQELGFSDFSLIDLSLMSIAQWKRRDYAIPKGYKLHRSKILIKIPPDELKELAIRERIKRFKI